MVKMGLVLRTTIRTVCFGRHSTKNRPTSRIRPTDPPTAIPMIAPVERPPEDDGGVGGGAGGDG